MICPGCNANIRRRGIPSHLRSTKNRRCQQYFEDQGKQLSRNNIVQQNGQREVFDAEGDIFGNYRTYLHEDHDDEEMDVDVGEAAGNTNSDYFEESDGSEGDHVGDLHGIEPERPRVDGDVDSVDDDVDNVDEDTDTEGEARCRVYDASCKLYDPPVISEFPGNAGKVYGVKHQNKVGETDEIYKPFSSKMEWEIARWAKERGPSSTAFTDLMSIDGVAKRLNLSFKSSTELNRIIDEKLPNARPSFTRQQVIVGSEVCDIYFRDIIQCVQAILQDHRLSPHMIFAPEKHYTDNSKTTRMFHDMHTAKWWWATQKAIEEDSPGGTIIPIMISTDKMQLTLFRNKSAYPVYLTIGNVPKEIRCKPSARAYVLLGYLPTTKLENVSNKASRRRMIANLYHSCMGEILQPLEKIGAQGIIMATADGKLRRMHPVMAGFIGDYPEQILATCSYSGDCPSCDVAHKDLGDSGVGQPRDLDHVLDILSSFDDDPTDFIGLCKHSRVKPVVTPFWRHLPYLNIYSSITPNVLHQLYQGLIKHVVSWLIKAFGPLEIDARCRQLPLNHNIRTFIKGISALSHVSGKEHDQISRILIGLVVGMQLGNGYSAVQLVQAVRALLDFLFLAQYSVHTDRTLDLLQHALDRFHENKEIFIDLGIRKDFNLPKLHFAQHYAQKIRFFGTADNFNTEYTERLHIDLAKDAYRATNRKEEYTQMTTWLERKEKISQHELLIQWRLGKVVSPFPSSYEWITPGLSIHRTIHVSERPSARRVPLSDLITKHGATYFHEAFARFVVLLRYPSISSTQLECAIWGVKMPTQNFWLWHRVKFLSPDPFTHITNTVDAIHANPKTQRFDTALLRIHNERRGIHGFRIGRVCAIFSMPPSIRQVVFRECVVPEHLVYIEWFTEFTQTPDPHHQMYKVSIERDQLEQSGGGIGSIVPLSDVVRSIHLFPIFGAFAPVEWTQDNVLDRCNAFYVNPFTDKHLYRLIG